MGIRYIALPISPLDIEEARACARCYLTRDTFAHGGTCERLPGPERERRHDLPDYLDLDKSWGELHNLFALPKFEHNAARTLVEGDVQHHGYDWIPYYGVLDPHQVQEVSQGLREVADDDIRDNVELFYYARDDKERDLAHVIKYLNDARNFTRDLAQAGYGLIYIIG